MQEPAWPELRAQGFCHSIWQVSGPGALGSAMTQRDGQEGGGGRRKLSSESRDPGCGTSLPPATQMAVGTSAFSSMKWDLTLAQRHGMKGDFIQTAP